jgi:hypothetical protein
MRREEGKKDSAKPKSNQSSRRKQQSERAEIALMTSCALRFIIFFFRARLRAPQSVLQPTSEHDSKEEFFR